MKQTTFYLMLTVLAYLLTPQQVDAQVAAGGLNTRVNGSVFGQCRSGSCAISGGIQAGDNLFYRLSLLDTRKGIKDIRIDTRGMGNLFLGVTNPAGAFLDKNINLTNKTNLFVMAPGGLWLGKGLGLNSVRDLILTTSGTIRLGSQTFDLIRSDEKSVKGLTATPISHQEQLSTAIWDPSTLGLTGNADIRLAGGSLTVDRHLLIDSLAGTVIKTESTPSLLQAGKSIRISAQNVDLKQITVTAGQPGAWGLIDVRANSFPSMGLAGKLQLSGTFLKGQQIFLNGTTIGIGDSRLEAPKGWIQVKASGPEGWKSELSIVRSALDVQPYSREDLDMPLIAPAIQVDRVDAEPTSNENKIGYPQIGLFSDGNISIGAGSSVNVSLDFTKIANIDITGKGIDWSTIADRSGIAIIKSNGTIRIEGSSIAADATNNMAGRIIMLSESPIEPGGIYVKDSFIQASNGASNGEIVLKSNQGITVSNSIINASSNRIPSVNGVKSVSKNGEALPYSFFGGKIRMWNSSEVEPIYIMNGSQIVAHTTVDAGILENPRLKPSPTDNDLGVYGHEIAFSRDGHWYGESGGEINIYSEGGINIFESSLDSSSGKSAPQNIGGTIGVVDLSNAGISMSRSRLLAKTGQPLDLTEKDINPGIIRIAATSNINISDTHLSTKNENRIEPNLSRVNARFNIPWLTVSSHEGTMSISNSTIDASYPFNPEFKSGEYAGINFYGKQIQVERTVRTPEYFQFEDNIDPPTLAEYIIKNNTATINSTLAIYGTPGIVKSTNINDSLTITNTIGVNMGRSLIQDNADSVLEGQPSRSSEAESWMQAQEQSMMATTQALGLSARQGRVKSIAELQQKLSQASHFYPLNRIASDNIPTITSRSAGSVNEESSKIYRPAMIHLQREDLPTGTTRITAILLSAQGSPISRSREVKRADLDLWIQSYQRQLSRRAEPESNPLNAGQKLSQTLFGELQPILQEQQITALLLEVDRGMQSIPFNALPIGDRPMADLYALSVTPSLGLIELDPSAKTTRPGSDKLLLAGSSYFKDGLSPLPMVRQELQKLASEHESTLLLDDDFTPATLMDKAQDHLIQKVHIATHVHFSPGQVGLLHTPSGTLTLSDLGRRLRGRNADHPLEMITLSGCLTALGDEQSELGFVGMALQAGARSGLGTLWEVDDTATAAFFIQMYRYLQLGLPKDQALQATQRAFLSGEVQLQGNQLVGPDPQQSGARSTLISGLKREQQQQYAAGLQHPYYWAAMVLTGSPW